MRVITLTELRTYSRSELLSLRRWIEANLYSFPEHSTERSNARLNLHCIRIALAQKRDWGPA